MIRIAFQPPDDDPAWKAWAATAKKRTRIVVRSVRAGKQVKINAALYKGPRQFFLRATHDKCAYCEVNLTAGQQFGDVEHFRPKGRITDGRGRVVMLRGAPGGPSRPHPGYPWLAYDPDNLLPSCIGCNRRGTLRTGEVVGKVDQFPVAGYRAKGPGEEGREKPLLLHPVRDDPEQHLTLQLETGMLLARTERGAATIKILGLNREGLVEARRDVATDVQALVVAAEASLSAGDLVRARRWTERIAAYREGSAPFSWAGRLTLDALGSAGDVPP